MSILTAMTIHAIATYGDNLSPVKNMSVFKHGHPLNTEVPPIRADIQNKPKKLRATQLVLRDEKPRDGELTLVCFCPRVLAPQL